MGLSLKEKNAYYRRKAETDRIIKDNARRKGHVIYGARAINAHLPNHLDKPTEDYDIYSKTPRKTARRVEKRLDKHYKGDYFRVEKAQHEGTYKVKSNVTNRGVADYTKPDRGVKSVKKNGVKYRSLSSIKRGIHKTLKDKDSRYRWDKDREALQRITIYEKSRKTPKKSRKRGDAIGLLIGRL